MVEKLVLKDGKKENEYLLEPILAKNEIINGAFPLSIYSSFTDEHYVISLSQMRDNLTFHQNLGIAHSKEELPRKLYRCAVEFGGRYASHLKCRFIDETNLAKRCAEFNKI